MRLIGVDTNILIRALIRDDPHQSKAAADFIGTLGDEGGVFVNAIVLCELLWTLRSQFGYRRDTLLDLVQALLERKDVEFADRDAVKGALDLARDRGADFSDAYIALSNGLAGCSHTVTFDQRAAMTIPSMELLT